MPDVNIFLVESPMQLLSAIEAKEYFKEYDSLLIIKRVHREIDNDRYEKAMDTLESFSEWDQVIKIPYRLSTFAILDHLYRIRKKKQKINSIFLGSPRVRAFQWFCENLETSKCFNLDEGTTAIIFQNDYFINKDYMQESDFSYIKESAMSLSKIRNNILQQIKNTFKIIIKRCIFGLNEYRKIKYNLFTTFDLNVNSEQEYVYNNYSYTKSIVSSFPKLKNMVYFYGSPLSEIGIINFDTEMKMLKKIHILYNEKGKTLFYMPHPSDSPEKISHIKRSLGIQIRQNTIAAEIDPILNKTLPDNIASFISTAIFVSAKIYDYDSVVSFRIPDHLIENKKEIIKKIYEEYEKTLKVVLLNEK